MRKKTIQRINSNPYLKLARSLNQRGRSLMKKVGIHHGVVTNKKT